MQLEPSVYRMYPESLQLKFASFREKIQAYCGGFGNGKSAAAVVLKALIVARDYPGANILVARETFPKLNDTIRKEFLKWCPPDWIKSFPKSANASNTCTLHNGTTINFRYIKQQGKSEQQSTSNLLSATYDLVVVDQIEDPGIAYKDFTDLLGRLRGSTPYRGDDDTMPRSGPRWLVFTANPTRNWVYKRIIYPLHLWQTKHILHDDLLCERKDEQIVLGDDGKPHLLIELAEGSTYENKENLEADFIQTLESMYRGQMRKRFLLGEWGAYEGLIYPQHDATVHIVTHSTMLAYLDKLRSESYDVAMIGGYDYGIAVPSCFLLGFVDPYGNVCLLDGFYEVGMSIEKQRFAVAELCDKYDVPRKSYNNTPDIRIEADPSIFRRGTGNAQLVGKSVNELFYQELPSDAPRVFMTRGNNAIVNGITKVGQYLDLSRMHQNPFTATYGSPHFYYSDELSFVSDEIDDYVWKPAPPNSNDDREDKPRDGNDHAMDVIRYMLSRRANLSKKRVVQMPTPNPMKQWHEADMPGRRSARHG